MRGLLRCDEDGWSWLEALGRLRGRSLRQGWGCWRFGHEASAGKGLLSGLALYVFGVFGVVANVKGGWGAILVCNARSLAIQV